MAVVGSSSRARFAKVVVVSLLALGGLGAPAAAHATHDRGDAPRWEPCFADNGVFECSQLRVPLDYDKPRGDQLSIAVIREPATGPGKRLGSIVVNPGGPGASGVDFLRSVGPVLFTPEVRARFDLVSFDPRGIIRSDPLRCFRSQEDWAPLDVGIAFPITQAEIDAWIGADAYLVHACDQRAGPIIDHMATANVARDMDELRAGPRRGEAQLRRLLVRHVPRRHVCEPLPGPLPVAGRRRRARSGRVVDRQRRRRHDAVLDSLAQRSRRAGDAGGVLPPLRRGRRPPARSAPLGRALCRAGRRAQGRADAAPGSEDRRGLLYNYSFLIGDTLGAMYASPHGPISPGSWRSSRRT